MKRLAMSWTVTVTALSWLFVPTAAQAQSLTVTLLPTAVTFNLTNGSPTNAGNVSLSVTTVWTLLLPGRTLSVYGYFGSAAAALAHTSPANTIDIPSSRIEVSVNGGAGAPFDQTVVFGAANGGRRLVSQVITLLTITGNRTDTLALNVNLSNYTLIADAYAGTLRLRAQVSP